MQWLCVQGSSLADSFPVCFERFRNDLFAHAKTPFARATTQKEWLRHASRAWDAIRKSPFLQVAVRVVGGGAHGCPPATVLLRRVCRITMQRCSRCSFTSPEDCLPMPANVALLATRA